MGLVGCPPRERHALYRTAALGTVAELLVTDPGVLVAAADILHRELERIDRLASRFRADSEISRLEEAGGLAVGASPDLLDAVVLALRMAEATDGALDPTVGAALCRLGYDRDFSAVAGGVPGRLPRAEPVPGWRSVEVDRDRGTIRVPSGTRIDLGATAKALAADRVAEAAAATLGCGVLVSLGGDVAVAGPPPAGGFAVGLGEACTDVGTARAVTIRSGGLATSGTGVRRWRLGAHDVHHIVDPATGLPAEVTWRTVSVAAATCVEANAAATAAVVKGAAAPAWLSSLGLPSRLVGPDGATRCVAGWPEDDGPPVELGVSA